MNSMLKKVAIVVTIAAVISVVDEVRDYMIETTKHTPKFEAMDCAKMVLEGDEFMPRRLGVVTYHIEKVGKEKYLYYENYGHHSSREWMFPNTSNIEIFDSQNVKVNCVTGEEL